MALPYPLFRSLRVRSRGLRLYLSFGLAALVIMVLSAGFGVSFFIQTKLEEKARGEVRALVRLGAHQRLQLSLLDQELGIRGYLASGDPAFLKAYDQGRQGEGEAMRNIMENLHPSDQAPAQRDIQLLESLVKTWHEEIAGPQIAARALGPIKDLVAAMEQGKVSFDAVRAQSDALERVLAERDGKRILRLEQAVKAAWWISGAHMLVFAFGGVLVVHWIRRKVAQPLMELAQEAQAGHGFLEPLEAHPVLEVDILSRALAELDQRVKEREQRLRHEQEEVLAVQAFTGLVQDIRAEEELLKTLVQAMERLLRPHRLVLLMRLGHGDALVQHLPELVPEDPARGEICTRTATCRAIRRMTTVGMDSDDPIACLCSEGLPAGGAYLCLPLVAAGQVLGLVNLQSLVPGYWTVDRKRVAEACVSVASAALQAIRALKLAEDRSIRDGLTGVYNRRFLDEMLPKLLEQAHRTGHHLSVLMVDLDHFKRINDLHGHDTGDKVLINLARCLDGQIRTGDVLARYGGEEFALLLPQTAYPVAMGLAERLRAAIEALPLPSPEFPAGLGLTASFGVATFPEHGTGGDAVFAQADRALYLSKGSGRNVVKGADELVRT